MNLLIIIVAIIIAAILISLVSSVLSIVIIIVGVILIVWAIEKFIKPPSLVPPPKEKFTSMAGMMGVNFDDLATYNFDFNFNYDPDYIDGKDGCVPFRTKPYGSINDETDEYEKWENTNTPKIIDVASIPEMMAKCNKRGTYRNCWHDGKPFQGAWMN